MKRYESLPTVSGLILKILIHRCQDKYDLSKNSVHETKEKKWWIKKQEKLAKIKYQK